MGAAYRTFFQSENGLVPFTVGFQGGRGVPLDVGREGNFAELIQVIENVRGGGNNFPGVFFLRAF